MNIFRILGRAAVTTVKNARTFAVLYVVNGLFALVLLSPLDALVRADLAGSALGRSVRGADVLWLGGALRRFAAVSPALTGGVLGVLALWLVVTVFLTGGLAGRIAAAEGEGLGGFFGDCGRFFWRFVRVALLSIPLWIVVGILGTLLSGAADALTRNASTEMTVLVVRNAALLLALLAVTVVLMLLDYTRMRIAAEDRRGVLGAFGATLRLMRRRFLPAWVIALLVSLVPIGAGVLFLGVQGRIPATAAGFALGFLWSQAFVAARIAARILFFASAYHVTKAAGAAA